MRNGGIRTLRIQFTGCLLAILCATPFARAEDQILNNFVTEQVNRSLSAPVQIADPDQPVHSIPFETPRDGWIFISLQVGGPGVRATLDSTNPADVMPEFDRELAYPAEAMRYVNKGAHTLHVFMDQPTAIENVSIRSIPLLLMSDLAFAVMSKQNPDGSHRRERVHPWTFYQEYILPNVNVIASDVDQGNHEWQPYAEEVRAQGKKWVYRLTMDWESWKEPDAVDRYYRQWGEPLENIPYLDGVLLDEWNSNEANKDAYPIFAEVFDRIAAGPGRQGKKVYMYGLSRPRDWYRPGIESLIRNQFPYMLEKYFYLTEPDPEETHEEFMIRHMNYTSDLWNPLYPGIIQENMAFVLAMWNYHNSSDHSPSYDHRVFLDMQLHYLANYSEYLGLYGISTYVSRSTTEEMMRYASALLRHYCIEGRRERYNNDPLKLDYLENPGFEEGLEGWTLQPATEDSISTFAIENLPFERRHWIKVPPTGQKAAVSIRSAERPNRFTQRIAELEPGRIYSLTFYTMDLTDPFDWHLTPFSVELRNVDVIEDLTQDYDVTTRDYEDGQYRSPSYHFLVFRARETEAQLELTDWFPQWCEGSEPVTEAGHEILWDHIQIQPYFSRQDPKSAVFMYSPL